MWRETAFPEVQTTTRMVLHPTPTASLYLSNVLHAGSWGERDADDKRLTFGSKLNPGGHPGGSGASAEGWEETGTLIT